MDWNTVSSESGLTEAFIKEHCSQLNWYNICQCQRMSESFIEEMKDYVNWGNVSSYQTLSETFIETYKENVLWVGISRNQKLSEDFIRKYKQEVYWYYIFENQILSEAFIKEHLEYVYEEFLCVKSVTSKQKLSYEFVVEHAEKLPLLFLKQNPHIVFKKKQWDTIQILSNEIVSEIIKEGNEDEIKKMAFYYNLEENIIKKYTNQFFGNDLEFFQDLSETFIEEMEEEWDWDWCMIARRQSLSFEFVKKHSKKIDFHHLKENENIHFTKEQWEELNSL